MEPLAERLRRLIKCDHNEGIDKTVRVFHDAQRVQERWHLMQYAGAVGHLHTQGFRQVPVMMTTAH